MHDSEKSASAIVAGKPPNKTGSPVAEVVEPRTASREAKEEGAVHRAPPPRQRRYAPDGVLRAQAQSRSWRGRRDVAGLRGAARAQARGSARTGPSRSLPATALPPDVHTEGGRAATAAGGRGPGGQDRPGGMRHGAQRHL